MSRSSTSASEAPIARASATARATSDESGGSHSDAIFARAAIPLTAVRKTFFCIGISQGPRDIDAVDQEATGGIIKTGNRPHFAFLDLRRGGWQRDEGNG